MNVGNRLRELRLAKGLSQGDIERRTGMLRCYISRVEGGYTLPKLNTLERWAKALDLELHQFLQSGDEPPAMPEPSKGRGLNPDERTLFAGIWPIEKGRQEVASEHGSEDGHDGETEGRDGAEEVAAGLSPGVRLARQAQRNLQPSPPGGGCCWNPNPSANSGLSASNCDR